MSRSTRIPELPIPYRFVWLIALAFTLLFVLQAYASYLYRQPETPFAWFFYVTTTSTHYFTWGLLAPLLYRFSRIYSDGPVVSVARVGVHLAIGLVFAVVQSIGSSALRAVCYYFRDGEWMNIFDGHGMGSMIGSVSSALVEYLVLIVSFIAIDTYKMYREKQVELVRMENERNNAQLQALKMQLQPHFLFNTLHSISSLMNEDIGKAQHVVTKLGYLLRSILDSDQTDMIRLSDELQFVRSYLDIEETRFEDRLQVDYHIANDTLGCQVPTLILQPLVENAIKHAFADRRDTGNIWIDSDRRQDNLVLSVRDNGPGLTDPQDAWRGSGVGLRNVQTRILQIYGERGSFHIKSAPGDGFQATITIPCETMGGT